MRATSAVSCHPRRSSGPGGATSHRKTGLVLAGGRVTEPKPIPDDEDAYVLDMSGG
ncbi:hypothetical protein [Streptomyces sp. NPDC012466]|uniref:hypothetical protein n=1 Tax=Streptomyces sp. NPDC012466 TaxID=3364835 RepID=UPI0036EC2AC6